jgi:hypothetical protein
VKVVSRYCDSCGIKIPATEIKDGTALKYEESYYCKDCKAEILPLIEQKKGKSSSGAKPAVPAPAVERAKPAAGATARAAAPARGGNGAAPAKPAAKPAAPAGKIPARPAPGARPPLAKAGASAPPRPGAARPGLAARKPAPRPAREPEEDEEAPEGSGDDLAAAEGAAEKKFPTVPVAIGAVVVVAIVVALLLMPKRGGGAPAKGDAPVSSAKSEEDVAKEKNKQLVADCEKCSEKSGAELYEAIRHYEKVLAEPTSFIARASNAVDTSEKIEAVVGTLRDKLAEEGKKVYETIYAKAQEQAKAGSIDAAIETLRGFPEEYRETWKDNIKGEIARLDGQLAAKREAEPILKKAADLAAAKEYAVAIGVLEGFDTEKYRDTEWEARVKKDMLKYQALASARDQGAVLAELDAKDKEEQEAEKKALAAKRAQEDKRIAGLSWERLLGDDLFTWSSPPPAPKGAWSIPDKKAKELVGKCGDAVNGQPYGAIAGVGKPNWADAIFKFRYKIVKGSFQLGARFSQSACIDIIPPVTADGEWHTVEVSVRGEGRKTELTITENGASKPCEGKDLDASEKGGFCFVLMPQSEVVFADLQVKVISTK